MAEPGLGSDGGPVVFLDIGATLVGADVKGPASRIGASLGFDAERRRTLRKALMTTDFVRAVCRARHPGVPGRGIDHLESVSRHYGALFDAHIESRLQLFSLQLGMAKPARAIFVEALRRAEVTPERAVMVGDSYDEDLVSRVVSCVPHPASGSPVVARTQDAAFAGCKGKSEDAATDGEAPPGWCRIYDSGH